MACCGDGQDDDFSRDNSSFGDAGESGVHVEAVHLRFIGNGSVIEAHRVQQVERDREKEDNQRYHKIAVVFSFPARKFRVEIMGGERTRRHS